MLLRRRSRVPFLVLLFIGLAVPVALLFIVELTLKNTVMSIAEVQASWKATEAIHSAVAEEIGSGMIYKDIVHIEKDKNNRIVFMQANIVEINRITSSVAMNIHQKLKKLEACEFEVPVGQMLGSKLLAHCGPGIKFAVIPVGVVEVTPEDSFQQAGINQTRHRIYLKIKSDVKVVIPLISSSIKIEEKVPIADAVIVGEVPKTYVQFARASGGGLFFLEASEKK